MYESIFCFSILVSFLFSFFFVFFFGIEEKSSIIFDSSGFLLFGRSFSRSAFCPPWFERTFVFPIRIGSKDIKLLFLSPFKFDKILPLPFFSPSDELFSLLFSVIGPF